MLRAAYDQEAGGGWRAAVAEAAAAADAAHREQRRQQEGLPRISEQLALTAGPQGRLSTSASFSPTAVLLSAPAGGWAGKSGSSVEMRPATSHFSRRRTSASSPVAAAGRVPAQGVPQHVDGGVDLSLPLDTSPSPLPPWVNSPWAGDEPWIANSGGRSAGGGQWAGAEGRRTVRMTQEPAASLSPETQVRAAAFLLLRNYRFVYVSLTSFPPSRLLPVVRCEGRPWRC